MPTPTSYLFLVLTALVSITSAQLAPSPTYNPQPASSGTVSTNGTTPNTQYSDLLGDLLWFFDAQRSGALGADNRVSWRNDSGLSDGSDYGIDLTGGWYDAGDYSKDTFPLTFTLFSVAHGALYTLDGYVLSSQLAYLDSTLRWGLDWCIKAHPSDDVFFVQVGNTSESGTYWGGDLGIPEPRPSYPVNDTYPGTDVAASGAAMFAISSLLYSTTASLNVTSTSPVSAISSPTLANATYSSTLLSHAAALYSFAMNATGGMNEYSASVTGAGQAYTSSGYGDDLTLGALALALATNSSAYYAEAYTHYVKFALSGSRSVLNWDSKTPMVYLLFVECALARPQLATGAGLATNLTGWQTEIERYLDGIVNGDGPGYLTKGGLLFYPEDSAFASLNPALNAAMIMELYAPLASTTDKTSSYESFAASQVDYALGKNPMNAVYVVGAHPNSAKNPSSAIASGGDDITKINTSPAEEAYVLYGAVVGGPDSEDHYYDLRDDYPQTEPALDENAPMLTLIAWRVWQSTQDPYYTSLAANSLVTLSGTPCDAAYPCSGGSGGGLTKGAKIAIGVLVPLAVLGLAFCAWFFWWRKRRTGRRW